MTLWRVYVFILNEFVLLWSHFWTVRLISPYTCVFPNLFTQHKWLNHCISLPTTWHYTIRVRFTSIVWIQTSITELIKLDLNLTESTFISKPSGPGRGSTCWCCHKARGWWKSADVNLRVKPQKNKQTNWLILQQ